ncbi:hypothetical protein [Modestobacter sp. KNN46-3]|uniref:hypothetical protein n=1 Tax=Modestobacter sp. KNN46-3 TaxID=2711218 RepID=UPI0013DEABA3|nr:hypothetical protein [Modestobacter sp. KNN46-3]
MTTSTSPDFTGYGQPWTAPVDRPAENAAASSVTSTVGRTAVVTMKTREQLDAEAAAASGAAAAFDLHTAESALRSALRQLTGPDAARAEAALNQLQRITVWDGPARCSCGEPALETVSARFAGLCWACRDDVLHATTPEAWTAPF